MPKTKMTPTQLVTPQQYLNGHVITKRLKAFGITDAQLNGVHFRKHEGDEFEDWRVISMKPWPPELMLDMRVWCTFRWLMLDDPPPSRNRRDAWKSVALYEAQPIFQAAARRQVNFRKGQKVANDKRTDDADNRSLAPFRAWASRVEAQLVKNKMDAKERVAKYIADKKPPDRQRRRLRALLKAGKI